MDMNSGNPTCEEIADMLTTCVGKCRRARSAEEAHARLYGQPWDQGLLDRFKGQFAERPELALIARMIFAEGYSFLAGHLLPNLERCLGSYVYEEFSVELQPGPLRPELVVANTAAGKEIPAVAPGKSEGKRAAARPAGDAA